jgi:hypothetical protein
MKNLVLCTLILFLLPIWNLAGEELTINSIYIVGTYLYPEEFIRNVVRISEGQSFASQDELEKKLLIAEHRLHSTERFLMEDLYLDKIEKGEVDIYIELTDNLTPPIESSGGSFILFPHFPLYKTSGGIVIGNDRYGFVLSPLRSFPLALYSAAGLQLIPESDLLGLFMIPGFHYSISPEITLYGSATFLRLFENREQADPFYTAVGAGLKADYIYLKKTYRIGIAAGTEIEASLIPKTAIGTDGYIDLYLKPYNYIETIFRTHYFSQMSDCLPFRDILSDINGVFLAPAHLIPAKHGMVLGLEQYLTDLINIDLGTLTIGIDPFLYTGSACTFEIGRQQKDIHFERAIGGGISLKIGMPVNLEFLVGYGYNVDSRSGVLFVEFSD